MIVEDVESRKKELRLKLNAYMYTTSLTLDEIADKIGISRVTLYYLMKSSDTSLSTTRRQTLVKIKKFLDSEYTDKPSLMSAGKV